MNKKAMIIDGNSILYKSFYGVPDLTTKKGTHTNAVFGFLSTLLKLVDVYSPDHVCVAFDRKAPTFRHLEYKGYKAKRERMPENLIPQVDTLKNILSIMQIPVYEVDRYEADDILGSFAHLAEQNDGFSALLVTGDRDALQLVTDETTLILSRRGGELKNYTPESVFADYGIKPEQIVDMKALMGDTSDNIPGVPGVGEKTALKLLKEYVTLDGVYENLDKITGKKLNENLTIHKDSAYMSRNLAEIKKDAPVDIVLNDCLYEVPMTKELYEILSENELKSILSRLGFDDEFATVKKSIVETIDITTIKDVIDVIDNLGDTSAILIGKDIHIAKDEDKGYRILIKEDLLSEGVEYSELLKALKPYLEDNNRKKICYKLKEFMGQLKEFGISINGADFDISIAAYLLNPTDKAKLDRLIYDLLDLDVEIPNASHLIMLKTVMEQRLKDEGMFSLYHDIEHPLISVLYEMEQIGFAADRKILNRLGSEFETEIKSLETAIYDLSDSSFNINSPKQLGVILFEKMELPVIKKTKTGYSTDMEVLERLKTSHPIIEKIISYRHITKLKSTYIDGLLSCITSDNRIHSSLNQTVTATGRLSSSDPNLQNIPIKMELGRQIRKIFVADGDDKILVDADYSQIELRVLAHMSGDATFIDAFVKNQDIHTLTASEIFEVPVDEVTSELRSNAKAVNFGIVYGISDYGLSRNLNIDRKKAAKYIESYWARYPQVKTYMDTIIKDGRKSGFVSTIMGRRRYIPQLNSRNRTLKSFGERAAMNTPIQGSAADIIKIAMIKVRDALINEGLKSKLILQIHDELIIEAYKDEVDAVTTLLQREMEGAADLSVPLSVDINTGRSWYHAK